MRTTLLTWATVLSASLAVAQSGIALLKARRVRRHSPALLVLLLLVSGANAGIPPGYTLTQIDVLEGGAYNEAWGLNELGQVVGACNIPHLGTHAFLWDNGHMTDLVTGRFAFAVNDSAEVVGADGHAGGFSDRGFLWQGGIAMNLPLAAYDINNNGLIAGQGRGYQNQDHAMLWQNGQTADLHPFGATTSGATALNDAGVVVGWFLEGVRTLKQAFLWNSGFATLLPRLGGLENFAWDINDAGQVVGWSEIGPWYEGATFSRHGFLWDGDALVDLGAIAGDWSIAYGINDAGVVVGASQWAFVWDEGAMWDLNDLLIDAPGWRLECAYDINTQGQIVGTGRNPQNLQRGFLLTPIPEPATLSLLAVGGLLLIRRRAR